MLGHSFSPEVCSQLEFEIQLEINGVRTHVMKLGQTCQRRSDRRLSGSPHVRCGEES